MASWDGTRDRSRRDSKSGINEQKVLLHLHYIVLVLDDRGGLLGVLQSLPLNSLAICIIITKKKKKKKKKENNSMYISSM